MSQNELPDGAAGGLEPPVDPPSDGPAAAQPTWPDAGAVAGAATPGQSDGPTSPPAETAGVPGTVAPGTTPDGGWTPSGVTPPEGWTASAATRPGRRFGVLPRLIIPGIIVVVLVGGFLFRDRISGNASDLKPGDCFDDPITAGSSAAEIKDVQHHPCTEPHLYEVLETIAFPTSGGAVFPGETGFDSFIIEKCSAVFASYVGIAQEQSSLTYLAYTPVESGWNKGDRDITCFLGSFDGSMLTGSMKNARR